MPLLGVAHVHTRVWSLMTGDVQLVPDIVSQGPTRQLLSHIYRVEAKEGQCGQMFILIGSRAEGDDNCECTSSGMHGACRCEEGHMVHKDCRRRYFRTSNFILGVGGKGGGGDANLMRMSGIAGEQV